jgi:hypothetical protein
MPRTFLMTILGDIQKTPIEWALGIMIADVTGGKGRAGMDGAGAKGGEGGEGGAGGAERVGGVVGAGGTGSAVGVGGVGRVGGTLLGTDIKVKNIRSKQTQMMAGFGVVGGKGSDAGQGNAEHGGGVGGGGVGVEGGGVWSSTSLGALVIGFSIMAVVVGRKRSGIRRSDSRGVCVWVRLGFSLSLPPIMPRVCVCVSHSPCFPSSHEPAQTSDLQPVVIARFLFFNLLRTRSSKMCSL